MDHVGVPADEVDGVGEVVAARARGGRSRAGSRARRRRWPGRSRRRTTPVPPERGRGSRHQGLASARKRDSWWITARSTPGGTSQRAPARSAAARHSSRSANSPQRSSTCRGGGVWAHDWAETASSAAKPSSVAPGQRPARSVRLIASPPPGAARGRYPRAGGSVGRGARSPQLAPRSPRAGRRPRPPRPGRASGSFSMSWSTSSARASGRLCTRAARIGRRRVPVVVGHVALAEGHVAGRRSSKSVTPKA